LCGYETRIEIFGQMIDDDGGYDNENAEE